MTWPTLPDVSRETNNRLAIYADLLKKWTPRINLVSRGSLADLWDRHIVDSAQIFDLAAHPVGHWADLGSGGGFPGLVVAIMAAERSSPGRVTLVESDQRKSTFLRTVLREAGVGATVLSERIEAVPRLGADIISARALTHLDGLLTHCDRHLAAGGTALFPKGATWKKELETAQRSWRFDHRIVKSKTEADSVILSITGVSRA